MKYLVLINKPRYPWKVVLDKGLKVFLQVLSEPIPKIGMGELNEKSPICSGLERN
jgi:hypothetical protein